MSLVNAKAILQRARGGGYAVGAFDLINLEFLEAILASAAVKQAPVILSLAQIHFDYMDLELIAPSLVQVAKQASVPVAVHLDHGEDLDTVIRAIRSGFSSVMIDGSTLPYEQNVALTREAVRIAHAVEVSVEGELGYVAGREFYQGGRDTAGEASVTEVEVVYTDPDAAVDFVSRTDVDSLAVSIGTMHGLHRGRPRLDLDRLRRIREKVPIPLVLHGGSGLTEKEYHSLIVAGISKINLYSELSHAATAAIRSVLAKEPKAAGITYVLSAMKEAVRCVVEEKIEIWGSAAKAGKRADSITVLEGRD